MTPDKHEARVEAVRNLLIRKYSNEPTLSVITALQFTENAKQLLAAADATHPSAPVGDEVERVARAIFDVITEREKFLSMAADAKKHLKWKWDTHKPIYMRMAEAAISALSESSERVTSVSGDSDSKITPTETVGVMQPAAVRGWMLIETAPRNGACVLVSNENGTWPAVFRGGLKGDGFYELWSAKWEDGTKIAASHWMPLPPPPGQTSEGGE